MDAKARSVIAAKMRRTAQLRGLSQGDLCRRTGLIRSAVSRAFTGKRMSVTTMRKLMNALELTPAELGMTIPIQLDVPAEIAASARRVQKIEAELNVAVERLVELSDAVSMAESAIAKIRGILRQPLTERSECR